MFLIEKAVEEQATQMDSVYHGEHLEAVVIGGKGGMGSWIARFLNGQGHHVSVVDPEGAASPFAEVTMRSPEVESADLVVVAVPMDATAEVLHEIALPGPGEWSRKCAVSRRISNQ